MNPTNIFTELKRRNVYRAAVAYGVVAWFLTQLMTQVFPFFEIPNSAVRFVVIALAVGFPIAMLLSWVYEFTPEGIVRTEDLDPVHARSAQRATLLRSSANSMLTRPRYDVPRANFANNHCLTVLRCSLSRRRKAFSRDGYHWLGRHELVRRKWRLNRVEYLITCTVSSSAR